MALREAARSRSFGGSVAAAKEYFARTGLFLASIEHPTCDSDHQRHRLIARAIRRAREDLLAGYGPPSARFVSLDCIANRGAPDPELEKLLTIAERPFAPTDRESEMRELVRIATAPQERQLIEAFREKQCRSLAHVERLYGWSRGQASVIASRLREKVLRKLAA
jgi:hypothetical protein